MNSRIIFNRKNRRGAAIVEFAVCLPMIMIIVLGTIESASLLFAKQAMVQTAYEAAMIATKHNGTATKATDAARRVALGRRIQGTQVDFSPSNFEVLPAGTIITVTATAPVDSNRLINSKMIGINQVSAKAVMVKE